MSVPGVVFGLTLLLGGHATPLVPYVFSCLFFHFPIRFVLFLADLKGFYPVQPR